MTWRRAVAAIAVCALAAGAHAQRRDDPRSLESQLKNRQPREDVRTVNANIPELVTIRLAQLEEDMNFTAAQLPLWNKYKSSVMQMVDDVKRGARVSASETNAPKRLDALADMARDRLTAVEDIVDAGKALYAVLTPQQQTVADRRLALPLATLTGNDAGSEARMQSPPPTK
jgi:hypothetical protein